MSDKNWGDMTFGERAIWMREEHARTLEHAKETEKKLEQERKARIESDKKSEEDRQRRYAEHFAKGATHGATPADDHAVSERTAVEPARKEHEDPGQIRDDKDAQHRTAGPASKIAHANPRPQGRKP